MIPMTKLISPGELAQVLQANSAAEGRSCMCDLTAVTVL